MEDVFKPRGQLKEYKPDSGGASARTAPVYAVVKDNIDPTRTGRLRVYISDLGGPDPDDSSSWLTVNYMTPFFGFTPGSAPDTGYGNSQLNSTSYGMWTSPPDIGTTVICIFINGDPNYGYWIGCVPNAEKLTMVPAIGGQKVVVPNEQEAKSVGGAKILPVTNMNDNDSKLSQSPSYFDAPKPINSYVIQTLNYQGLLRDNVRGVISSSAQRETPSRVGFGVSTPGRPIYKGGADDSTIIKDITAGNKDKTQIVSRRPGHSFVMDDGDIVGKDQLIRLRTSLGHQILMSDDGQCLFIIHANGRSWIELGKEGTIDMYATNSVNIRTQGDLNLHADRNVNINALGDLNLKGDSVNIEAEKNLTERAGINHAGYCGAAYTYKATAGLSMSAGGIASISAVGPTFIKGKPLFLNTGTSPLQAVEVPKIPLKFHVDTLYDNTKGWSAAPGKLVSITSRAPAHAPWAYAGLGVDVNVNNNAASALPSSPNSAVAQANQSTKNLPPNPTLPSLISTVPPTPIASGPKTTEPTVAAAMVSQMARQAAQNPATKDAVAKGQGIAQTPAGPKAVVGALAATPDQLEQGGYIKPGSATLVNSLIQQGKTVEESYTANLFTGKDGVNNLSDYINKVKVQVSNAYDNFGQAERGLIRSGAMTGTESGNSTAGMIMATATEGLTKTLGFIKNAFSSTMGTTANLFKGSVSALAGNNPLSGAFNNITNSISSSLQPLSSLNNSVSGMFGNVSQAFSAGNFSAALGNNIMSGLSGLATSVVSNITSSITTAIFSKLPNLSGLTKIFESLVNASKGISDAAFKQITASYPNLTPNQPNNLENLAIKAVTSAQDPKVVITDNTNLSAIASGAASAANNPLNSSDPTYAFNQTKNNISSGVNSMTTATSGIVNIGNLSKDIVNVRETTIQNSSTSSGVDMLPGGTGAVASVVDNNKSIISTIPGLTAIQGATKTFTSAVTGAFSPISNLGTSALDLFNKLNSGKNSLSSLATLETSPANSSQLQSALKSLSAIGPSAKPAVVATNTDSTNPNTNSFLPRGTPAPNYTGVNSTTTQQAETQLLQIKYASAVEIRNNFQQSTVEPAIQAYNEAKKELPAGDPEIERLAKVLDQAYAELRLLDLEISKYTRA